MNAQEVGAEVVTPGGDTVRLIDDQLYELELRQIGAETWIAQPFR